MTAGPSLTLALQPRLRELHFSQLFQPPTLLWGPVSAPKYKQNKQTPQRQSTLTPCWDVNRCQGRSTLYYYMLGHPPQSKGPCRILRLTTLNSLL